ncbi:MAG TPA: diguanylate cyclase [Candidatus Saccharimonadales bacterium]|nr:diguanylate cyclase [Candidatus Saccharimonadales bacterium]
MVKLVHFNITVWFGKRSRLARVSTAIFIFTVVALALHFAPPDAHIFALFLVPISFAAWFISRPAGWVGAALASAVLFTYEIQHNHERSAVVFLNFFLNMGMYSFFALITSQVRSMYAREQELSLHDPLTGLLNRRAMDGALGVESRRLRRRHYPFTLAYIDLDDFKKINDLHGHAMGDAYIQQLAMVLKSTVRATDFVARMGGDEFVLLLPETGPTAAQLAIAKVQENVLALIQQRAPAVTVSIGVITFETTAETPADMIRVADEAMYEVKHSGKNRVTYKIFRAGAVWPAVVTPKAMKLIG